MILYAITIFLSAFLLFQVQPLIAKVILPWFGGSAAVWTVCMLFFQVLLLAGYVYSHAYVRLRIPARRHIHIALLSYPLAVEPLLALGTQAAVWSAGFALFALACAALAWRSKGAEAQPLAGGESGKPGPGLQTLWASLACCASLLLLAFTGHMTLNIAAIPFLWA